MKARQFMEDLDLKGRRVLIRVDFNVPLDENQKITDNARIAAALPSIRRIIESGGKCILMSHLGRPKGERLESMSLKPAAEELSLLLEKNVSLAPDCIGSEVEKMVSKMEEGELLLLENLRFHQGETKNDPQFCEALAGLGEVYINDAFGTAHRAHASTAGVAALIEDRAVGYLIRKELEFLGAAVLDPQKPFTAILGGAKVSDKIILIERLMEKVDGLIIGGGMANTFLKAQGMEIGDSLLEEDALETAKELLDESKKCGVKIHLPVDVFTAPELLQEVETKFLKVEDKVQAGWKILDIGPESVKQFGSVIQNSKTVLWNGPMGVFEYPAFASGTRGVTEALAKATDAGAVSIIGGGDSAAAVNQFGMQDRITHISTGGGASLEFLEGKELPGVSVIPER
ncbi:MAG: phosphoglycerate kinase [bacterium]